MKIEAHNLISLAVQKLQSGEPVVAEIYLEQALTIDPNNFEVLCILGIVKISQKNLIEAASILKRAYSINPNDHALIINLGQVLMDLQLFDEAHSIYFAANVLFADDLNIQFGLANSLHQMGCQEKSIHIYEAILERQPYFLNARINLAALFSDRGEYSKALALLEGVLSEDISIPEYWSNLAATYLSLKMGDLARKSAEKALSINPNDPLLSIKLGEILLAHGDSKGAINLFENAISLDRKILGAYVGLGNAYSDEGLVDKAMSSLDMALTTDKHCLEAWCAKGLLLKNEGQSDQASNCFLIANQLDQTLAEPIYNLSHIQLQSLNFKEGWSNYEARWRVKAFNSKFIDIDKPLWTGLNLQGALLIWGEQGVGDQILYASTLSLVSKRILNIIVLVDERLLVIFSRSFPNIRFVSRLEDINLLEIQAHIPMGSLGKYFLQTLEDFSQRKMPYLISDQTRSKDYKEKIGDANKLVCGLSWTSKSMKHSKDKSFSLVDLAVVLDQEKMTFVDIGYVDSHIDRANLLENFSIQVTKLSEVDSFHDIDGLAALIDACDLIITCSNTCAHLAGALGKKVYLMVPEFRGRFWYWKDIDGFSLWYPSIKVLARSNNQSWGELTHHLKQILGV